MHLECLVIKLSDKQLGGFHVHFKFSLLSGSEGLVGLGWGVRPTGPLRGSGRGWGSPARRYAAPSSWRRQGQSPASPQASEREWAGGGESGAVEEPPEGCGRVAWAVVSPTGRSSGY